MPKAIVFDAVGTLIHVNPSVATLYAEIGRRFGSRLNADEIHRRFPAAFARQERLDRDLAWRTDEARERQRWIDIVAEVLDDVADSAACFEALFHAFGEPGAWSCDPEAAAVVSTLQKRGCILALASNFDRRLRGLVEAMPPLHALAPIVISSEVGWRKPAPQFFEYLGNTLKLAPCEILYVGDDRVNDFDGARQAGIRAVLLDPHQRHRDVVERIERLAELPVRA